MIFLNCPRFVNVSRPLALKPKSCAVSSNALITDLQKIVGQSNLITDREDLVPFNTDWMGKYVGHSLIALTPTSTIQVSQLLKFCNKNNLKVVPQGGNTGLVGGSVPLNDEIILSLKKLSSIHSFSKTANYVSCDSGCILQNVNDFIAPYGQMMPIDLGAKGSCHLGGLVSTNAGGLRFLRYGSLKQNVLGLEVVLPSGDIVDLAKAIKKDNTGYDLKQLFIGSEGTLGVITKVVLATVPKPESVHVALLGISSFEKVKQVYNETKHKLGEITSAVEFFDKESLELVKQTFKTKKMIMDGDYPFYMLIETHGSNTEHDISKLETLLEHLLNHTLIEDGILAQDLSQFEELWRLRENIPDAVNSSGKAYKYDLSLPLDNYYECVEHIRAHLESIKGNIFSVCGYGHIGDGNIHLNVVAKEYNQKTTQKLEPYIFEFVKRHNGSISAEHGLGQQKSKYIEYSKPQIAIEYMQSIKQLFDPNNILNPYKVVSPRNHGK